MTIEEIRAHFNATNRFLRFVGGQVTVLREGYAEVELTATEALMNSNGTLHGGLIYTLADTAAGAASKSYDVESTTLEGKLNYIRPGSCDLNRVKAVAQSLHSGRKTAVYDTKVYDHQDKLLAAGLFTMYIF